MDCLSYCRKGPASPQFAQSAQWCKQRYCIDLIYPILLLAVLLFAILSVGLLDLSSRWCFAAAPHGLPVFIGGPASCLFPMVLLPASLPRRPGQQLPHSTLARQVLFATAPRPATNLIWQRRSPVWLAIWRTWAGFANSQHRDAAFVTPDNICAHSSLLPH